MNLGFDIQNCTLEDLRLQVTNIMHGIQFTNYLLQC